MDEFRFEFTDRMQEHLHVLTTETPACWRWPVHVKADVSMDDYALHELVTEWQGDRCAVCALRMRDPKLDHDHVSGLVRGWLCRGCNLKEGHGGGLLFDRYREQHPTSMLGIQMQYFGR